MKITKRKDGRYQCNVYIGTDPITGRKIQKTVSARTKSECRKKATDIIKDQDSVVRTFGAPKDMTLCEMCDIYFFDYTGHLRETTKKTLGPRINHNIKSYFGQARLSQITPVSVQTFVNHLAEDHAPRTVGNIYHTLSSIFALAVEIGYLAESPCRGIRLPKPEKCKLHPFDEDQLKVFLASTPDDVYGEIMRLDVLTGLRESEIIALTWDRVDLDAGRLTVDRTLGKGVSNMTFNPTKNGRSRVVPLPAKAVRLLRARRARQAEDRMRAGAYWDNPEDLVFTTSLGRRLAQDVVWHHFHCVCRSCGFEGVRFHDLRHTYAVLSLRSGVDYKSLSEALGHASVAFTMDVYAYVTDAMREDHATKLDRFLADF